MFKKMMSVTAALCVACTALVPASLAAGGSSFTDMSDPEYEWAVDAVEDMTRLGIIKGYTDGTFKPANAIKKIEMLLLMARAAGYTFDDYSPFAEYAAALYAPTLAAYDMGDAYNRYKNEVAFLLYKGIISTSELNNLLSNADSPIKRYEAAVLLTKLMGAEEQVRKNIAASLDYADYSEIPASARTYVEYVTKQGLMNGIGNNTFGPMVNIDRAQIAVILSRVSDKLNYSAVTGTVSEVDTDEGTVSIYRSAAGGDISVRTGAKTRILVDGKASSLKNLPEDSRALVLYSGSDVVSVEALTLSGDSQVFAGVITNALTDENGVSLLFSDLNSGTERSIIVDPDVEISLDGRDCEFDSLRIGQYVMLTVTDNKIKVIAATTSESIPGQGAGGTIYAIQLTPEFILSVENSAEEVYDYAVSSNVRVTRNGETATLRDLIIGDKVKLTLNDEIVTAIAATGSSSKVAGTISSIVIENTPKITLRSGNDETAYPLSPSVKIEVFGNEAELYDLRLGSYAEIELDSSVVVRVNVTSEPVLTTFQINGYIADYNLSYGYVNIDTDDGIIHVLMSMSGSTVSTAVIDSSTGDKMRLSELEIGQRVTAIGSSYNDTYTATTIVVIPE